jgi:hypothetical protein
VPKRYTPEEAKQLLLERGFSPLEPYHGAKERWKAKHLDCGGTVFITLNSIRNPRTKLGSCANCASNAATSEVDAVKIMKKAGLRPLVKFPGYDNPWKSTHVKCGRTVSPRLHSIKAGGNGCRKCGFKQSAIKRTTKNDIAIAELNSAGFEPLEQFRGVRIGWKSRCLTCKKVSSPQLGSIRAGRGCQHCANNVRLEHDEAVVRMKKFGVTPLVPYKNAVTPWKSRCMTQPVQGGLVVIVALVGIAINGSIAYLFFKSRGDLNIRSAFLNMALDTLASVGALLAGLIIVLTGKTFVDPFISVIIGCMLLYSGWSVIRSALHLLFEGVPEGTDIPAIQKAILTTPGVKGMDDLHVWALSTTGAALSCHLVIKESSLQDSIALKEKVKQMLSTKFHIEHATIETELTEGPHHNERTDEGL